MWTITCPVTVPVSKKGKPYILNLNVYRNTHFLVLNKAKESFKQIVTPLLKGVPKMQRVKLTFTHFPGSNRLCDTSNVCAVVDKFFCDALVTAGHLEDDNYTILPDVHYIHGGVDKGNGRVEVLIEPMGKEVPTVKGTRTMQLILSAADIELAISNYVNDLFTLKEGTQVVVTIDGEVSIDLLANGESPAPQQEKKPRAARQGRTVTAKPTEVVKDTPKGEANAVAGAGVPVETTGTAAVAETKAAAEVVVESPGVVTGGGESGLEGSGEEGSEQSEEQAAETPPASRANSLFAGLGRVKN